MWDKKTLCFKVSLMCLYIVFNLFLFEMQYNSTALIILRFIPSWKEVIIIGNGIYIVGVGMIILFKKMNPKSIILYANKYIIPMIFFIGISVLAGILTSGEAIRAMLLPDKTDMFMDFFNSIQYGFEPYGNKVIYPPLINLFYALCGSMIPLDNVILDHAVYIRDLQMGWVVLYGVMMLTILGISVVICYFLRNEKITTRILFLVVTFCSLPFVFAVERGNSLLQTLLFLLLFLHWYKSEKRKWRYLAYVSLGVAAGIKIVPIIFGLLVVRRKLWRETGIAMAIVAIIFYVPFIFLDGDLSALLSNIQHTTALAQGSRVNAVGTIQMIGNGVYVNLWNSLDTIGRILNVNLWNASKIISVLILSVSVGCTLFTDKVEEWKIVAILSLTLILLPGFSAIYSLCYMIMPLVLFLRDNRKNYNRMNDIYILLFLCMFIPVINFRFAIFAPFREDAYLMRLSTILESSALLVMLVLVLVSIIQQIDVKRKKMIIGGGVALSLGYALVFVLPYKSVLCFVPGDMSIVNASEGLVLEHGRYCGIQSDGRLTLQTEEIKKYGLIVAADKGCVGKAVNLYLDGNKVATHLLDEGNWYIYIPAERISELNLSNTVDIGLSYDGDDSPVRLSYAGKPRLTDVVYKGSYMDDISEGFWRKTGEAELRMGKSAHVLLAGDIAKKGLLVRYNVPARLLVSNPGINIELEFYIDGRRIKSIPVTNVGEQVLVLQSSEIEKNGIFPYAIDFTIKCNAVFSESDDGESLNNRDQSIELISIGNVEAEPDVWSHWLKGEEKFYLSAEDLKRNGFCLTYHIDSAKLQHLHDDNLQMDVIMDGEIVAQRRLTTETSDSLDGIFLASDKFAQNDSIVCAEIRLTQNGDIPWKLLVNQSELIKMLYVGVNKIPSNYVMPNTYAAQIAMSDILQDDKDKKMYLGQRGSVLFLQQDMSGHDLVIDYDVPTYLLDDDATNFTIKIHDQIVQQIKLNRAGRYELRIPAEQLQFALADTNRSVIPIKMIVNKIFNPMLLHIFGIGNGDKSIILHRIYLD